MSFTFEVIGKTDVGCISFRNEDNFGYDSDRGIFVVCDGMGGPMYRSISSKVIFFVNPPAVLFRNSRC